MLFALTIILCFDFKTWQILILFCIIILRLVVSFRQLFRVNYLILRLIIICLKVIIFILSNSLILRLLTIYIF